MKAYKLLIVDDEPWIREGLQAIISRISPGWEVVALAADCEEAMEAIDSYRPHLVITDICMPGRDGIELHKWIRDRHAATYVLVLSGYADFEYARQTLSLGAVDYLIKPVQNALLETRLLEIYNKLETEQISNSRLVKEQHYLMEFWFNHLLMPQQYEIRTCGENLTLYGFPADPVHYQLVCLMNNEINHAKDALSQKAAQYFILKTMQELAAGHHYVFLGYDRHIYAVVVADQAAALEEITVKFCGDMVSFLTAHTTFAFAIGASRTFSNLGDFPEAGKQAKTATTRGLAKGQKDVLHWSRLTSSERLQQPSAPAPAPADPAKTSKREVSTIELIKQYISNNLGYDLSLQTVGKQFFLNPSYLSIMFKQETGENFIHYVTQMRMKKAKLLLSNPKLNVNEISAQIGYSSQRHFTKLFKDEEGIRPTEYRRLFHQKEAPAPAQEDDY